MYGAGNGFVMLESIVATFECLVSPVRLVDLTRMEKRRAKIVESVSENLSILDLSLHGTALTDLPLEWCCPEQNLLFGQERLS